MTMASPDFRAHAAPAAQDEAEVRQVLHLPGKMKLMRCKCCAFDAKAGGVQVTQGVARLPRTSMKVLQVLHLPPNLKMNLKCQVLRLPRKMMLKCSACRAKAGGARATQHVARFSWTSTTKVLFEGAPCAAPATSDEAEVLQVLRLPCKIKLMCSKMKLKYSRCCACPAK